MLAKLLRGIRIRIRMKVRLSVKMRGQGKEFMKICVIVVVGGLIIRACLTLALLIVKYKQICSPYQFENILNYISCLFKGRQVTFVSCSLLFVSLQSNF